MFTESAIIYHMGYTVNLHDRCIAAWNIDFDFILLLMAIVHILLPQLPVFTMAFSNLMQPMCSANILYLQYQIYNFFENVLS